MDLRKLKTLIDLVAESDISELEITEAEGKVRIVKSNPAAHGMQHAQMPMMQTHTAPMAQAAPAANVAAAAPVVQAGNIVKSPMVGTFYRASSPNDPAFVDIGSAVKTGETICIIEAMKLLNEIECDFTGTVTKILVENGQPVEYGQPLFVVE